MTTHILSLVLLFISSCCFISCANILGIFFHGGKSHHILGEVLFIELARRGHNVTMASPFPLKEKIPGYTDIHLTGAIEDQNKRDDLYLKLNRNPLAYLEVLNLTRTQVEITLAHPEMKRLVQSGTKFDLIIEDWFLSPSLLIYGHILDAPVILISSAGSAVSSGLVGNPSPPSFVSSLVVPVTSTMNLWERTLNSLGYMVLEVIGKLTERYHDGLLQKYFEAPPSCQDLISRIALILGNAHYSYESPRPYVPNFIPVGGFHIQKLKKLPDKLEKFLNDAKDGVIYFSLGSIMKVKNLPKEKIQQILKAFSQIKQKVLWKWEDENTSNLPENVKIQKWIPQNEVLAHPNVKLFITHCGLLSTVETIYHGKPIIGIPIFGDQRANSAQGVDSGFALKIEFDDLNEHTLLEAITTVLGDARYKENAQRLSSLLKDQPIPPMDKAVFWVEHVIKHKGAKHLKNAGTALSWYQYLLLDVVLLLSGILIFLIAFLYLSFRITFRLTKKVFNKKRKSE